LSLGEGPEGVAPLPLGSPIALPAHATATPHLTRIEAYVLFEAVRAPKGVLELERLDGPEEARFTAAKRLESSGLITLLSPSTYQITRKGRDPRLLAEVALQWIRRKP
jgi:hypothetical protein